jgi:hypothetical protein
VKRGRGKQKAPKKPYTPKKKGVVVGGAPKTPREPYTPPKKDVVAAGAGNQTLQQVLIHALCHPLLAFKLQRDAP